MVAVECLVTVAVLGASVDVTVTLLDWVLVKTEPELMEEWPDALTISVNPATFSPTAAVKVHVPVESELSLKVVDERERRRTLLGMESSQPPRPRCHPGERYATYVEAYHQDDSRHG